MRRAVERLLGPRARVLARLPGLSLSGGAKPLLFAAAVLAATACLLRLEGRFWWCACGELQPFAADAWGRHNSQHVFDPYSLTHLLHGFLLCGVLALLAPRLAGRWRVCLGVMLECLWELLENSAAVIRRYRYATAAVGYSGDSIANSLGDVACCAFGIWLAGRLGLWRTVALAVVVELSLCVWIRDSLLLNVIMLIWPLDALRAWQVGG